MSSQPWPPGHPSSSDTGRNGPPQEPRPQRAMQDPRTASTQMAAPYRHYAPSALTNLTSAAIPDLNMYIDPRLRSLPAPGGSVQQTRPQNGAAALEMLADVALAGERSPSFPSTMPRSQYPDYASTLNTKSTNFHPSQSVPQDQAWARAGSSHAGSFGHAQPATTTTYSSSGSVSEKGSKTGQHQPRSEIFFASRSTSTSSSFAGSSNQFYVRTSHTNNTPSPILIQMIKDNSNYTTSQLTHPRPHRDSPEVQFLYASSRPHDEGNPPLSENHLSSSSSFSPSSLSESRARVASQHEGKKKSEPESTRNRPGDKYLKMFLEPEQVNYEDAMLEILDGMPLPHPFNASSA